MENFRSINEWCKFCKFCKFSTFFVRKDQLQWRRIEIHWTLKDIESSTITESPNLPTGLTWLDEFKLLKLSVYPFTVELGDTLDFATSPLRLQHLTLSALSLGDAGRLGIPVVHVSRCRTWWRSGKKLVTFCGLQFWSSHPMVQELKSLYLDLDLYLLVSIYHSISVSICLYLSIYLPTYQSIAIKVLESLKDLPSLCHLWQVPSTSGGSDIPHLLFDLFALMHDLLFRLAWGRCWHNRTHHFHHFS